jgi:hypothetical protein
MRNGWVQVVVPDALAAHAAGWRVRAGGAEARPGERLAVAPGEQVVRVEAELTLDAFSARAALVVTVRVEPGGLTRVHVARVLEPALALLPRVS